MNKTFCADDCVCIILAGGRGKRMASAELHKVCFPIAGVPAIVRAVSTYKKAGLRRFLIVVGQMSEQVMSTVTAVHPEVTFVYQNEPRGTGHAALVAAESLALQGFTGSVLVTMGDKVTWPETVKELLDDYTGAAADLVLTTLPKTPDTSAGRIVCREDGSVLGIVETADIRKGMQSGKKLKVGKEYFHAATIESVSTQVNASLYMYRFEPFLKAVRSLTPDNAQGELYLTDTVDILARKGRVQILPVADPRQLMAYNTPAELLAIEDVVRRRETAPAAVSRTDDSAPEAGPPPTLPLSGWRQLLESRSPELCRTLSESYGSDSELIEERRLAMLRAVNAAAAEMGDAREVLLCRAPGRINLMGRHVDHRGGSVNVVAINREVLIVAAARDDDLINIRNLDAQQFPERSFRIQELLGEASWADWMDFLNSATVRRVLETAPGDWSHYARAPLLRLQHAYPERRLLGMDCVISGNVPMGAGLSSSSALVVAFAMASVAINRLALDMRNFVDLCGEGEWFVGSRGGSADHAAIRSSRVGQVSKIGFFPFENIEEVNFPEDLQIVIADSGVKAIKSAAARDVFNQRIACYNLAEMLLRKNWPAAAGTRHLRDLLPVRMKVEPTDIYRALMLLPERPVRKTLEKVLPAEELQKVFATHKNLGAYDLRGVALFGLSECERSRDYVNLLRRNDLDGIGHFMRISHDGDRVCRADAQGHMARLHFHSGDAALKRLAAANLPLYQQSGHYACSTPEIDMLVDLADAVPGVVGAQLAGAGLGGCLMILARKSAVPELLKHLEQGYYTAREMPLAAYVCQPVAGAGLIEV